MTLLVRLGFFALLVGAAACSASTREPATLPPTSTLGLALEPAACVVGANTVFASAFVTAPGQHVRYLSPNDGLLRIELAPAGAAPRPVELRWLQVPKALSTTPVPRLPPNLELTFHSLHAGACPLRVELQPSPATLQAGLAPALTTIIVKEAPPLPPRTAQPTR